MNNKHGLDRAQYDFLSFFSRHFSKDRLLTTINPVKLSNPLTLNKKDLSALYRIGDEAKIFPQSTTTQKRLTLLPQNLTRQNIGKGRQPLSVDISLEPEFILLNQDKKRKSKNSKPFDPYIMEEIERLKLQASESWDMRYRFLRSRSESKVCSRKPCLATKFRKKGKRLGYRGPSQLFKTENLDRDFSELLLGKNQPLKHSSGLDPGQLTLFQFKMMSTKQQNMFRDKISSIQQGMKRQSCIL